MMTIPAAPAATALSTLVWKVQVPRRISAAKPRSNSSKSVVLQPLAEASGGCSASPTLTARSRAVTLLESELVKVRKAEGRAPRRRGTRILQRERDSLPPSISPQHTPRNDRSRACRRLGCHHSWRRCLGTPAGDERCPRLPPRRVQEQHHRRCFPPWQFGLAGLQQTVRRRDQSSLGERTLRTALRCIRLTVSNRGRRMVGLDV